MTGSGVSLSINFDNVETLETVVPASIADRAGARPDHLPLAELPISARDALSQLSQPTFRELGVFAAIKTQLGNETDIHRLSRRRQANNGPVSNSIVDFLFSAGVVDHIFKPLDVAHQKHPTLTLDDAEF